MARRFGTPFALPRVDRSISRFSALRWCRARSLARTLQHQRVIDDSIRRSDPMPTYVYRARDMRGKAVSGTLALASEKSVREHLRMNDLFVTDLVTADEKEQVQAPYFRRRVKLSDL